MLSRELLAMVAATKDCPDCRGWGRIYLASGIPNKTEDCPGKDCKKGQVPRFSQLRKVCIRKNIWRNGVRLTNVACDGISNWSGPMAAHPSLHRPCRGLRYVASDRQEDWLNEALASYAVTFLGKSDYDEVVVQMGNVNEAYESAGGTATIALQRALYKAWKAEATSTYPTTQYPTRPRRRTTTPSRPGPALSRLSSRRAITTRKKEGK